MKSVIKIEAELLPVAWERAVIAVYRNGWYMPSAYDDNGSRDATLITTIGYPNLNLIHKNIPDGIKGLEKYRQSIVHGSEDYQIEPGKKDYTYHNRLVSYNLIDQLSYVVDALVDTHYTRRAQAITWMPEIDTSTEYPPCFCSGTKVTTPNGLQNIEDISDGDVVYSYSLKNGSVVTDIASDCFKREEDCTRVVLPDRIIDVSDKQLLYTNSGWKEAQSLSTGDLVRVSTICDGGNISDWMMVGYLHGDGWLSSHKNDIRFSIHPQADITWLSDYLHRVSESKLRWEERFICSDTVPNGGLSKRATISDKNLWVKYREMGCPVGRKVSNHIRLDPDLMERQGIIDFLIGIYSAKGSIVHTKSHTASIQIGMNWKECMEFVSKLLDKIGVAHSRLYHYGSIYKLYVDTADGIRILLNTIDFRLDSRKQAKYLKLKNSILLSVKDWNDKIDYIHHLRELAKEGIPHRILRQYKGFSTRVLKPDYAPKFKINMRNFPISNNYTMLPVISVEDIGRQDVFDLSVNHDDHSIIANGIVAHNCLQRMYFRIYEQEEKLKLGVNIHWRSRDLYKAWFMNMYGLISLIEYILFHIRNITKKDIRMGRIVDICDSAHIYGKDLERAGIEVEKMENTGWGKRVYELSNVLYLIEEEQKNNPNLVEDKYWIREMELM